MKCSSLRGIVRDRWQVRGLAFNVKRASPNKNVVSQAVSSSATYILRQQKAEALAAAIAASKAAPAVPVVSAAPMRRRVLNPAPAAPATTTIVGARASAEWNEKQRLGEGLYQPQRVLSSAEAYRQVRKLGTAASTAAITEQATFTPDVTTAVAPPLSRPGNLGFYLVAGGLLATGGWLSFANQDILRENVGRLQTQWRVL